MTGPRTLSVGEADELVADVASLLPFRTILDADMGGTWADQIYFGDEIDESIGRPVNRAGIDPDEEDAVWWLDFEVGARQVISDLGADSSPEDVAAWIIANIIDGSES